VVNPNSTLAPPSAEPLQDSARGPIVQQTLIRVVSLARDTERRHAFTQRAASTTLQWCYFDAAAGLAPELLYSPEDAIVSRGRTLSAGELGCYSSHYLLWLEFLNSSHEQLLVLEDDTLIDWHFLEILLDCSLDEIGLSYLRLFAKAAGDPVLVGPCLDRYLYEHRGYSLGSQAYILTRAGAKHMVKHLQRVRCPIDDALDKAWSGSLPTYALFPYPVIELAGASRIGVQRHTEPPMTPQLQWRRLLHRIEDRVLRTAFRVRRRLSDVLEGNRPSQLRPRSPPR
jgi:glycosyl transferase, family 25